MLYATVRQRKVFVKKPTAIVRNGVNVDTLVLEMDDEWAKMTSIRCIFSLQYTEVTTSTETVEKEDGGTEEVTTTTKTAKEINKERMHTFGKEILVPWECLTETGNLSVSCIGYVGDTQIMRTMKPDSFWDVVLEGHDTGDEPLEATPTLYDQVVAAAGAANAAAAQATQVSNELTQKAEGGEFDGEDGLTPVVEIGSVQTGAEGSEAQVTNTGTFPNVVLNFTLPRGPRGLTGSVGPQGVQGVQGPKGEKGETGDVGPVGPVGPQGEKGEKGDTGPAGPQGLQGEKGTTGEQGPKGDKGDTGATGPQGATGPRGATGATGAQGPKGADGKTPVKGTDYFTTADKQEIAQQAASMVDIPSGSWNDLTDKPSTFPPAAHNQAASTITSGTFDAARIPSLAASKITAGTFAGQVVANASGQDAGSYVLRNSKLSATAETPTVNGQICWKYE